MKITAEKYVVP